MSDGSTTDPAARHANALLRDLGLALDVPARPDPTSPALDWVRSGAMALTGPADGPPGFAAGPLASAALGLGRALEALAPGCGFAELDAPALLAERAALFGLARRGEVSCGGSARLLPTRDGRVALNLPREEDWDLLPAWLERERPAGADGRDWSALARTLVPRDAEPLVERGREIGLAIALAAPAANDAPAPFRLEPGPRAFAPPPRRPDRLRVLDLSSLWAGPLAGALLAQAGAEVLKVESARRPDGARSGEPRFFSLLNGDKHGCALDLTEAPGRELFLRLLESADVVLESARPRALAQLGIDARTWVAGRPGRLWASITGYGRDREWIAFGDDAAVAAGLAFEPGDASAAPRFCADAIADPLTGLTAAVSILALHAQGRGGLLALALADVAAYAARGRATVGADASSEGGSSDDGAGPLTLPVARHAGLWQVQAGEAWIPVAPPRARTPRRAVPPLAPPDPAFVARWTRAC
jgi:hypothetical protein